MDFVRSFGAILGSFTGLLTAILTVYGLVKILRNRTRLVVRGTLTEFHPFPGTEKAMREFRQAVQSFSYSIDRDAELEKAPTLTTLTNVKDKFANVLRAIPKTVIGDVQSPYADCDLFNLKYHWNIEIENPGRLELKELKLHAPIKGLYVIERPGAGPLSPFDRESDLGSLRARERIIIQLWTSNYPSFDDRPQFRVTHAADSVRVQVGLTVYGWLATLGDLPRGLWLIVFIWLLLVPFTIAMAIIVPRAVAPAPTSQPVTMPTSHAS